MANNSDVGMGEEFIDSPNNLSFLFDGPIPRRFSDNHERYADRVAFGPSDARAGDMASSGFEVERDSKRLTVVATYVKLVQRVYDLRI